MSGVYPLRPNPLIKTIFVLPPSIVSFVKIGGNSLIPRLLNCFFTMASVVFTKIVSPENLSPLILYTTLIISLSVIKGCPSVTSTDTRILTSCILESSMRFSTPASFIPYISKTICISCRPTDNLPRFWKFRIIVALVSGRFWSFSLKALQTKSTKSPSPVFFTLYLNFLYCG